MKFTRPRKLEANTYSDLTTLQPELFHDLCNNIIYPPENSDRERYLLRSIEELKLKAKTKNKQLKLNQLFINKKLYFMNICLCTDSMYKTNNNIYALVDTGAANSLIHTAKAKELGLMYKPCTMTICTATGTDSESVKGIAHTNILMRTTKNRIFSTCLNFIVTDKLNGLDCIIGANFLMEDECVLGISNKNLTVKDTRGTHRIRIADDSEKYNLEGVHLFQKSNNEVKNLKKECTDCTKQYKNNIHSMWIRQNGRVEI